MLWFNLAPAPKGQQPPLLAQDGFREAISLAVDRRAFANEVYLGAAEPSAAPVPPSVKEWATDIDAGRYDAARAAARLDELGIVDRNKDGVREDARRQTGALQHPGRRRDHAEPRRAHSSFATRWRKSA